MPEIAGRRYEMIVGTDVATRDGEFLELYDGEEQVLEVFYSDIDGSTTFTAYRQDLPLLVVEWAIAEAKARLTPR
jgi:hypothetical protein